MKQLIFGVIILGMIASIVAVFLSFDSRNKAINAQLDAEDKQSTAEKQREEAFEIRDKSLATKQEAERIAQEAEVKRQEFEKDRDEAVRQIELANNERDKALDVKAQAEKEREDAILAAEAAKQTQKRAELIQAKAEADKEIALADRNQIQAQLDGVIAAQHSTEEEYRKLKEVTAEAAEIARFTSKLIAGTFIPLDNGDKHYMNGCDRFGIAKTPKEKYIALKSLDRAKQYYETSLGALKRIENVNEITAEVVNIITQAMGENISSVEIVRDTLTKMLSPKPPSPPEIEEKGKQAITQKHSADNTVVTACARILDMMEDYRESFTRAQRAKVERLKKRLADRIGPSGTEENSSSPSTR